MSTIAESLTNGLRISIADDDINFITILCQTIAKQKNYKLVSKSYDGEDLLLSVQKEYPHLVLVDIQMPIMDGIEATKMIKELYPITYIISLSSHNEPEKISAIMNSGANGYIFKSGITDELNLAIECVLSGNEYISKCAHVKRKTTYISPKLFDGVKDIDMEIMRLTGNGYSAIEIGGMVHLSHKTIEVHKSILMSKYGLENAAEFVRFITENLI